MKQADFQRTLAIRARDAALARILQARRGIIVAALALSGVLAGLASILLPGKSFAAKNTSAARASTASSAPALPAPASAAQLGLQGPSSAPASVPPAPSPASAPPSSSGTVVSGSS